MAAGLELRADALRSLAFGSIGASYAAIGTAFEHPMRMIMVQNYTDALLLFSFDGVVDHFVLPAGGQYIWDITTNQLATATGWFISEGTTMYVKRSGTPTSGSVYVSANYARGT